MNFVHSSKSYRSVSSCFNKVINVFFSDAVSEKQIENYNNLLCNHTNRLEEINLLKNCLFLYKPPINVKVIKCYGFYRKIVLPHLIVYI